MASLFVIAELIKSFLFGGFSWLLLGQSQNQTIFDIVYPIFGSSAVSFIVVFLSGIFYRTIAEKNKDYSIGYIGLIVLYLIPYSTQNNYDHNDALSYTIYQPNLYPDVSYNEKEYSRITEKYLGVLRDNKSSDIIIFPETILPIPLNVNIPFFKSLQSSTSNNNILITGLFTKNNNKFYNSMIFFSDEINIYNKRKLVPFGEYTPWYDSLFELSKIMDIPLSNLSHGEKYNNIHLANVDIIPMICFESTFPRLIESSSDNEIIVNISNDGWFGRSLAAHQHLQITQIRALEFNRFILRATNTGISAVISNDGQILDYIENDVEGTMKGKIPIKMSRSLYSEYGDIWILMLIFFSLLAKSLSKARNDE